MTDATKGSRRLQVGDIADLREYEREREATRARVMALKERRRVHLGPIMTLTFENRETVRYQVQEMARAEKLISDAEIQGELDAYNPMIPEPGQLCATLFLELTTDDQLREWLPKLVGIERSLQFRLPDSQVVRSASEEQHARQLTREHVTAAVHYVQFDFTPAQVTAMATGEVLFESVHPEYPWSTRLGAETLEELRGDLGAA